MNETNAIPHLDQILKVNNELLGLPALPLIFFGCIFAGMFFKSVPVYPNRWIPTGVFITGIAFNIAITPMPITLQQTARAILLGLIAGGSAWIAYRKWISKLITSEDLQIDSNSKAFTLGQNAKVETILLESNKAVAPDTTPKLP